MFPHGYLLATVATTKEPLSVFLHYCQTSVLHGVIVIILHDRVKCGGVTLTATWNDAFEDEPANSDNTSAGDDEIRTLKEAISERAQLEHAWDPTGTATPGGAAGHGWHLEGSAKSFYQAAAPTTRPDASTSLDSNDEGRLWVDSDTNGLFVYTGSAWSSITRMYMRWSVEGTLAVTTDIKPRIVVPRAGTIRKVTIHAATGPTGAALIMDINKNGTTTIFDTRVQIDAGSTEGSATTIDAVDGVLAAEDYLTFDIDQVGSTVAGADLTVTIEYDQS